MKIVGAGASPGECGCTTAIRSAPPNASVPKTAQAPAHTDGAQPVAGSSWQASLAHETRGFATGLFGSGLTPLGNEIGRRHYRCRWEGCRVLRGEAANTNNRVIAEVELWARMIEAAFACGIMLIRASVVSWVVRMRQWAGGLEAVGGSPDTSLSSASECVAAPPQLRTVGAEQSSEI